MTLSNKSSVEWRLNDLLAADRKAKAYAEVGWNDPDSKTPEAMSESFQQWTPSVVGEVPVGDENQLIDEVSDALPEDDAEPQSEEATEGESDTESLSEEQAAQQAAQEAEEAATKFAEEALQSAKKEAHDAGYQKGRAEAEAHFKKSKDSFENLVAAVRSAQSDMNEFYQPLKKLALHLAQQLVRGELSLSSSAIERLTKGALDDIESQGEGPIIIYLHPSDREYFGAEIYDEYSSVELRSDSTLSQGSVRVSIDDSAIEDLIEQRLDRLAQQVLGFSAPAKQSSEERENQFANQVEERVIEGAAISVDAAGQEDAQEVAEAPDLGEVDLVHDIEPQDQNAVESADDIEAEDLSAIGSGEDADQQDQRNSDIEGVDSMPDVAAESQHDTLDSDSDA